MPPCASAYHYLWHLLIRLQTLEIQLAYSPANCHVEIVQELVTTHLVSWLNFALKPENIAYAKNFPAQWWNMAFIELFPQTVSMSLKERIAAVRSIFSSAVSLPKDDDDASLSVCHALRGAALEALTRALRLCVALGAIDFAVALMQLTRVNYANCRTMTFLSICYNAENDVTAESVTNVSKVTPQMVVAYTKKNLNTMRSPEYVSLLLWLAGVTRTDDSIVGPLVTLDYASVPVVAASFAATDTERQWSLALCAFFAMRAPTRPAKIHSIVDATTPLVNHQMFCSRFFEGIHREARAMNIIQPGPHHDDSSYCVFTLGLLLAHALAADVNAFAEREFHLNPTTSATGNSKTVVELISSAPAFGLWIEHSLTPLFSSSTVRFGVISELLTIILSLLLDVPKSGPEFTHLSQRQRRALQLLRRCLDPVIARLQTTPLLPEDTTTTQLHSAAGACGAFTPLLLPLLKQPSVAGVPAVWAHPAATGRVSFLSLDDTAFMLQLDINHPKPGAEAAIARLQNARRAAVLEWLSPKRGQVWMPSVSTCTASKQLLPFGDEPMTAFALTPVAPLPYKNSDDDSETPPLALPVLSPARVSPHVLVCHLLSLIDNPSDDAGLNAIAAAVPGLIFEQASERGAMHDRLELDAGRWRNNSANPVFIPSLCHLALRAHTCNDLMLQKLENAVIVFRIKIHSAKNRAEKAFDAYSLAVSAAASAVGTAASPQSVAVVPKSANFARLAGLSTLSAAKTATRAEADAIIPLETDACNELSAAMTDAEPENPLLAQQHRNGINNTKNSVRLLMCFWHLRKTVGVLFRDASEATEIASAAERDIVSSFNAVDARIWVHALRAAAGKTVDTITSIAKNLAGTEFRDYEAKGTQNNPKSIFVEDNPYSTGIIRAVFGSKAELEDKLNCNNNSSGQGVYSLGANYIRYLGAMHPNRLIDEGLRSVMVKALRYIEKEIYCFDLGCGTTLHCGAGLVAETLLLGEDAKTAAVFINTSSCNGETQSGVQHLLLPQFLSSLEPQVSRSVTRIPGTEGRVHDVVLCTSNSDAKAIKSVYESKYVEPMMIPTCVKHGDFYTSSEIFVRKCTRFTWGVPSESAYYSSHPTLSDVPIMYGYGRTHKDKEDLFFFDTEESLVPDSLDRKALWGENVTEYRDMVCMTVELPPDVGHAVGSYMCDLLKQALDIMRVRSQVGVSDSWCTQLRRY